MDIPFPNHAVLAAHGCSHVWTLKLSYAWFISTTSSSTLSQPTDIISLNELVWNLSPKIQVLPDVSDVPKSHVIRLGHWNGRSRRSVLTLVAAVRVFLGLFGYYWRCTRSC